MQEAMISYTSEYLIMPKVETRRSGMIESRKPEVGDWLWRPFYAKFWWSLVPIYWAGKVASIRLEILENLYSSALAGFVNVFFFPPLIALILSYGFFKAWLATAKFDLDEEEERSWGMRSKRYGPSGTLREFSPLDPASGSNWIGSPLNPSHPFYVIRHRHSS
jgi:hypothetical protein